MALSETKKDEVWGDWMKWLSNHRQDVSGFNKTQLRTSFDNIETWLNLNYNSSTNTSFRSVLGTDVDDNTTKKQKIKMFASIVEAIEEDS